MNLPPFLLDHWLSRYDFAEPPIEYNLASSMGPRWTLDALQRLDGSKFDVTPTVLGYAPSEGVRSVREAVADFHAADPASVVMTTGASEALLILLYLLEWPGGNLVIPDPAYPAYAAMAEVWRLGVRIYRLTAEDGFAQRAVAILDVVDENTVAVLVNTPHNPTGSVMETKEVETLAARLGERSIPLIVDEVYHPLYLGSPLPSAAGVENVIVVSDMSKALSLPGLRAGWIIDKDPERRRKAVDARSYFTISGSPVLEALTAHALTHREPILARLREVASANVSRLEALVAGSGGVLAWVRPRGGTTAFPWFADGRDSRGFCEELAGAGVLLAPGDCFGHAAHVRIGFAQQAEGFDLAVRAIAAKLEG